MADRVGARNPPKPSIFVPIGALSCHPVPTLFSLLLAVAVPAVALVLYAQHRRSRALRALARELGFAYSYRHHELDRMLPGAARFGQLAARHQAWNAMRGVWRGTELVVFDHAMSESRGTEAERHRTTALFLTGKPAPPDFEMGPENLGSRIGKALVGGDVDLPDAPWLDARIHLRGGSREAVRAWFSGPRARALKPLPLRLGARSGDGWLAVFHPWRQLPAEGMTAFLDEAVELARALLSSPAPGTPPPPPPPPAG